MVKKVTPKKKAKKKLSAPNRLSKAEKQNLDNFCVVQNWEETGEFIDAETAGRGHKQWRTDNGILRDQEDDAKSYSVVATYFSAMKVKQLLSKPGCNGMRIYFCKSKGSIGGRERKYRDLFLMPTKDGVDMINIKEHVRKPGKPIPHNQDGTSENKVDDGILNSSKPCPNYCFVNY